MELVYIAMLLHRAGKPVDEANVKKVVDAVGLGIDDSQIKALVAALENVDIDKVISEAAVTAAPQPAQAPSESAKPEEKKEEKSEKEKEEDESKATAGLGALFG